MPRPIAAGNLYPRPEWSECCWPRCDRLADGGGPPLCPKHFREVGIAFLSETPGLFASSAPQAGADEGHPAQRDEAMRRQSQVYYIRIGDHVKIGYTINLRQRLGALRVDDDALLATEPGGRALEAQRHAEFAEERVGRRENFNPSRRLLAHIQAVVEAHGPPLITTYPKYGPN